MNANNKPHFLNGNRIPTEDDAKYLGVYLNKKASIHMEINTRIQETLKVVRALSTFWNKTLCPIHWKLTVYNAVCISKLTYGMETLQLNNVHNKRLDAFQMRGLRKIMGIPPT